MNYPFHSLSLPIVYSLWFNIQERSCRWSVKPYTWTKLPWPSFRTYGRLTCWEPRERSRGQCMDPNKVPRPVMGTTHTGSSWTDTGLPLQHATSETQSPMVILHQSTDLCEHWFKGLMVQTVWLLNLRKERNKITRRWLPHICMYVYMNVCVCGIYIWVCVSHLNAGQHSSGWNTEVDVTDHFCGGSAVYCRELPLGEIIRVQ